MAYANEELFQKPEYKNVKKLKPRKVGINVDEDVFRYGILKLYHKLKSLCRV